ncbi:MAG: hypothetical protein QXL77_05780 [Candidatus Bathyarchaeia archaeon]
MIWHDYQLDNVVYKVRETTTLWKAERGMVEVNKDTLAVLIKMGSQDIGCLFHGKGKLILDTIIETNKGAIGRSVEKEIEKPFIMIGSVNSVRQNFVTADFQDLVMKGYKEGQEFIEKAESLCERFFGKGKSQACGTFGRGFMFAFLDDDAKLEVLIAENSKIVYRARAMTFISNKNRIILKTLGKTVVANSGRAIVLLSNFAV